MRSTEVLVPVLPSPGHQAGEVIAEMGQACSAIMDASFVVGRLPSGPRQAGTVRAFLVQIERGGSALVELPGIAVGALRGYVQDWRPA